MFTVKFTDFSQYKIRSTEYFFVNNVLVLGLNIYQIKLIDNRLLVEYKNDTITPAVFEVSISEVGTGSRQM